MIQQVLIIIIFIAAVTYLARLVYRSFAKGECASGCGKCGVADYIKLQRQLKEKNL
jgi:hypothetical protein